MVDQQCYLAWCGDLLLAGSWKSGQNNVIRVDWVIAISILLRLQLTLQILHSPAHRKEQSNYHKTVLGAEFMVLAAL